MTDPPPAPARDAGPSLIGATSLLAGGTAVGQLAAFLLSPLLAILFDPAAFGVLASFVAVVSIVTVVAALRYELAIPLPADDRDAAALVMAGFALCAVCALATWPLLRGLERLGLALLPAAAVAPAAAAVFACGGFEVLNRWAMRQERIALASASRLVQGLTVPLLQLALGWLALLPPAAALIAGYLAGRAAALLVLAGGLLGHGGGRALRQGLSARAIFAALVRYRRFPLFTTAATLMNALGARLLILYLAVFAGAATAGACAFAYLVLAAPAALIAQATAQTIHARGARARAEGRLGALLSTVFAALVRTGVPIASLAAVAAPEVFPLIFGEAWRPAGNLTAMLVPWVLVAYLTAPLTVVPAILERQPFELAMQTTLFAVRLAALGLAWALGEHVHAVWLFSAASAAAMAGFAIPALRWAGADLGRAGQALLIHGGLACVLVLVVMVGRTLAPEPLRAALTLATVSAAAVAVVGAAMPWPRRRRLAR